MKDATFDKSKGMWTVNIESGKSLLLVIFICCSINNFVYVIRDVC